MSTAPLLDQAAAEIERLEDALAEARQIIALFPALAFHAPFCRSREPGFLLACDCGVSDLLMMIRNWEEAQA